ncbi:hypothetical protein J5N97_029139 [Dioscorea zingiberensis]|uniref:Uncharacterized protein n=1 Tax=Dioscorea zingiberensis TaxID=325984 RepID=A0A9D5C0W8_9LILI|nr:hypothetical protein J5N97_029139 [Dioscorea zingiberensis]
MKMELSNALSTSCDTPRLSMEITYSMDTASQDNVMGPLPALIFIDISEMAKKWQKVASFKRKISSPRADECADFSACSTSSVAEKGHFFVYTSDGKRFMVPLAYLDNNIFKELLKISEEEFGLPGDGPITLPCDAVSMEYVLCMLRRGVSQEVERALLSSIFMSCQSSCSTLAAEHTQQLAICSF